MKPYPLTASELRSRFSSEDACRTYLEELRWPKVPFAPGPTHPGLEDEPPVLEMRWLPP